MHGINEFKYQLKGKDDYVQKRHFHNEIEIIYVVKGKGHIFKNDVLYDMQDHMLFFIDARNPHIVHPEKVEDYIRNKLVISADSFFDICETLGILDESKRLLDAPPTYFTEQEAINKCDSIFYRCSGFYNTEHKDGFIWGAILEFIIIYDDYPKKKSNQNTTVERIIKFIENCSFSDFSLNYMCNEINISKYYACHIFKKYVGMTIHEYILNKKIVKSRQLLTYSTMPIYEVAEKMGFNTSSSYVRFFKKETGLTPLQFRNSL